MDNEDKMTIRGDWSPGQILASQDLNDTFLDKFNTFLNAFGKNTTDGYRNAPIGTILSFLYSTAQTPALPSGWALCDGNGGRPNLTSDVFLRGVSGTTMGGTGGSNTHTHPLPDNTTGGNSTSFLGSMSTNDNTPPFYSVVFIIKVGV